MSLKVFSYLQNISITVVTRDLTIYPLAATSILYSISSVGRHFYHYGFVTPHDLNLDRHTGLTRRCAVNFGEVGLKKWHKARKTTNKMSLLLQGRKYEIKERNKNK